MAAHRPLRILVLTPYIPGFPSSGSPARTFCLCRQMAARGHRLALVATDVFGGGPEQEAQCHELFAPFSLTRWEPPGRQGRPGLWRRLYELLFGLHPRLRLFNEQRPTVGRPLREIYNHFQPDILQVEESMLFPWLRELPAGARILLNAHNLEFLLASRMATRFSSLRDRLREQLLAFKYRFQECANYRKCDHVAVVSEPEKAMLSQIIPGERISVVPNGVDYGYFAGTRAPQPYQLLFTGKMDYTPNLEAVQFFAQQVLPRLRGHQPQFDLQVVGMGASPELYRLAEQYRFTVTGAVPDVRPYFSRCTAAVVPLLSGAGTRLKILEALAAGCPVVSTTLGAEGLDLKDGQHLLIADDAEAFAEQIMRLHSEPQLAAQLALQGQTCVSREYDWAQLAARLEEAYWRTLDRPRRQNSSRP